MAKKQITRKKKQPPFAHPTKHGRLHWKKVLFIILFGAFGIVIAGAVTAQVFFNRYINQNLTTLSVFQMRTLIGDAIEGLIDIHSEPDNSGRIVEARLQLPPETEEVKKVLYIYNASVMDHGNSMHIPESLQVTTLSMANYGEGQLNGGLQSFEELFNRVPEAQACTRGFLLQFEPSGMEDITLSGTKKLADGRTLYVYRENRCQYYNIEQLEDYLLQTQSY